MNCREFENIVNDLAHAKLMSVERRVTGLAHAETCPRCAARLADERELSERLKCLAASDEGKLAPSRVEAALLEAFRAQMSKSLTGPSTIGSETGSENWSLWTWPRLAGARWALAATAILVAVGFIIYYSTQDQPPNRPRKDDVVIEKKSPTPQPSVEHEERIGQVIGATASRHKSRSTRHRLRLNRLFIRDSVTAYADDTEYLTDFLPLRYGDSQKPMESGALIRVQMPRSALARFGLPVNAERADAPIKADLLVGEDGLAHAIRFVR
jgi:hypothetical protein